MQSQTGAMSHISAWQELENRFLRVSNWQSQSQELNPQENVWRDLKITGHRHLDEKTEQIQLSKAGRSTANAKNLTAVTDKRKSTKCWIKTMIVHVNGEFALFISHDFKIIAYD